EVHQEIERLLADAGGAFGAAPVPVYLDHPVLDGLAAVARAALDANA
ncbi:MAG: pantothenate kinase, partial [Achromobacter sp.]|nr:pantothenate kinase [Achromobacter sp.]